MHPSHHANFNLSSFNLSICSVTNRYPNLAVTVGLRLGDVSHARQHMTGREGVTGMFGR